MASWMHQGDWVCVLGLVSTRARRNSRKLLPEPGPRPRTHSVAFLARHLSVNTIQESGFLIIVVATRCSVWCVFQPHSSTHAVLGKLSREKRSICCRPK